jgi:hypothetical protein
MRLCIPVVRVKLTILVLDSVPLVEPTLGEDFVAEVPFADERRLVLLKLPQLRKATMVGGDLKVVFGHAGCVGIQAGHNRGPRRATNRLSDVGVLEEGAVLGERV